MNEVPEDFESQLARLRPQGLRPELVDRIAAQLERTTSASTWADRCLMTFMGGGALAASVIVGLLMWQMIVQRAHGFSPAPPPPGPIVAQRPPPGSVGEYERALARSDQPTLELLR
jgi:hypothetical protein